MATRYSSPIMSTNGLVLYYDAANKQSYPGSGTTCFDISNNSNTGTLTNGATFNTLGGGSINFDGTDDYIAVPYNSSLGLSSQGTLAVWIYPNQLNQELYAGLVGMTTGGNANQQSYYFHWRQIDNVIQGGIGNSGTYNTISVAPPTSINWYYYVFTWNGSNLNLYQNGVRVATPVTQTINPQALASEVAIGGKMFSFSGYPNGDFNGKIAITQIYNRGLSAEEVLQNYNATKTRFGL